MQPGDADFNLVANPGPAQSEHRLVSCASFEALEDPGIETIGFDIGYPGGHANRMDVLNLDYRSAEPPFVQRWIILERLSRWRYHVRAGACSQNLGVPKQGRFNRWAGISIMDEFIAGRDGHDPVICDTWTCVVHSALTAVVRVPPGRQNDRLSTPGWSGHADPLMLTRTWSPAGVHGTQDPRRFPEVEMDFEIPALQITPGIEIWADSNQGSLGDHAH